MLFLVITFFWPNKNPEEYSPTFNIFYLTFSRALFIFGLNLFLLPMLMGHGEFFRNIMAADIFTPLARLTFGAYMTHPMLTHFFNINN